MEVRTVEGREMKKRMLMAALLLPMLGTAQALEVRVFEPSLERVIGYGKLEGSTLNFSLLKDASGPAVVFLVDDGGDIDSFKASIDKNTVSLALSSGSNTLTALKSYAQSKGWAFVQTLVNGALPSSSGAKKK